MKRPRQLPQRGRGLREQLPTATGAAAGAATPGPGPATSSGDHGGDIRCLAGSTHVLVPVLQPPQWGPAKGGSSPGLIPAWPWLRDTSRGF